MYNIVMEYTKFISPTKVFFGKGTELLVGEALAELKVKKVLVHYGSQSAVKSGLLAKVEESLKEHKIRFVELGGVQPNPRLSLARKGIEICKSKKIDFVLAVGGGSAIDSAKCIAYGAAYNNDVWDIYSGKAKPQSRIGLGVVLTLSATGSELSDSSVITNDEHTPFDKIGANSDISRPDIAFMNPELTYSVSKYQTGCGSSDIMIHTLERYFNNGDEFEFTDKIATDLLRCVIDNTLIALKEPNNYEARKNIMWAGSLSHNNLTEIGYNSHGDWSCHRLEHELSALYDVPHGAGLTAIWGSWARYVCSANYSRFAKLGKDLFNIKCRNPKKAAEKTIRKMEDTFKSFGMPTSMEELGLKLTDKDIKALADKASLKGKKTLGSFKVLKKKDMYCIYQAAQTNQIKA